jgi:hypothetical protein
VQVGLFFHNQDDFKRGEQHSVADIQGTLNDTLNGVRSAAHILSLNRATLSSIHTAATAKKRNLQHGTFNAPEFEHAEVTALQAKLAAVRLKSWNLDMNSALLMRTPGNADYNALSQIVSRLRRCCTQR